ncbi:MAG TPA: class I SAM-dependent methyltransferase [Ktedonobacteraceae bacterium]|nr:class I SAM-dependent methyltransferase [Ktedonobacteraceae bacterium]
MHSHGIKENPSLHPLNHFNFLFSGWGSHVYDMVMVRLTRRLYHRVIEDTASLRLSEGNVLDAGTGPGTLARELARRQPQLEVYGIDLSGDMIQRAREHTKREQLEERVHFDIGNVAQLPYPDHTFDVIISTISMHHWYELEQPLRDLYRVLRPGGRLWIYDFRFVKVQAVEKALASTPFAGTKLEHSLVQTGSLPFTLYRRFALQKA